MVNTKRGKRSSRRRVRRSRRKAGPVTSIPTRGLSKYPVMRSFSMFADILSQTSNPKSNWLNWMRAFGAFAMKIFSTLVLSSKHLDSSQWVMTGIVQGLIFGPEDLVYSSPIREDQTIITKGHYDSLSGVAATSLVPAVDYRQGKLENVTIRITSGSELSKRAGRLTAALIALTQDEANAYRAGKGRDVPSFAELQLMPGARTAPWGQTLVLSHRHTKLDFGSFMQEIGQLAKPDTTGNVEPPGGVPTYALYIGYQDLASTKPDASVLYAPEEAIVNVDISGNVHLREWGRRYIRPFPIRDTKSIVYCDVGGERFGIHRDKFSVASSGCLELKHSDMPSRMSTLCELQDEGPFIKSCIEITAAEDFTILDSLSGATISSPAEVR